MPKLPQGDGDAKTPRDFLSSESGAPFDDLSPEQLLERLLMTEGREQKQWLARALPQLTAEYAERLAPLLRAKSPRIAHRVTAFLARAGAHEAFEAALRGLPEGKIRLLRSAFARQASKPGPAADSPPSRGIRS